MCVWGGSHLPILGQILLPTSWVHSCTPPGPVASVHLSPPPLYQHRVHPSILSLLPACPVPAHYAGFPLLPVPVFPPLCCLEVSSLAATYSIESLFSPWLLRPFEIQSPPAHPAEFSTLGSGHLIKENSEELTPSLIPHLSSRHSQEPPSNTLLLLLSSHPHESRRGYMGVIRRTYPLPAAPADIFARYTEWVHPPPRVWVICYPQLVMLPSYSITPNS